MAYYFFDGVFDGGFCQGFIKRVFKHFRRCKDYSHGIYAVRIFCVEACDFCGFLKPRCGVAQIPFAKVSETARNRGTQRKQSIGSAFVCDYHVK